MSDLPKDALYQIFARLPIKSLARFRCVCKLWCNYIDDPYLASINVKQTIPMMLHQYHSLPEQSAGREFNIIESEEGNSTIFKVKQDPIYRFQCNRDPIVDIGICNGMIFFSQYDISSCTHFSVIHPLRKERYELPFLDLQFPLSCPNAYGLGFDDSTKTFKVVCLFDRDPISTDSWGGLWAMVHVLGTYWWRKIPHIPDCSLMQGQGVFVKGLLHWVNDLGKDTLTYAK
uniref:F-box/kelch-repeat protein At3g23880-like n=1 Tax=Erigeron canadensis TaxID=72917 RepID=UPI001CB922F1|nr:F-box/kelch-repeat protein At3g23880-like [Erigeron canadensis]